MKRWLVRICVFLILGAIVNGAVAWVLALQNSNWWSLSYIGIVRMPGEPPEIECHIFSKAGATSIEARPARLSGRHTMPDLPYWSDAADLTPTELARGIELTEFARGWPCESLYGRRIEQRGTHLRWEWAVPILVRDKALPLMPIWPGFAINAVFYAALLFGLAFALSPLVRTFREILRADQMRRGLCPKCAYDLRGSAGETCPECGTRIAPSPRPSPSPMR